MTGAWLSERAACGQVELYQAYADYHDMQRLTEEMIAHCCREVTGGSTVVEYEGTEVHLHGMHAIPGQAVLMSLLRAVVSDMLRRRST
eukprot:scaffold1403_cov381-Prasinococcus_capsulatus_cf.AAC.13